MRSRKNPSLLLPLICLSLVSGSVSHAAFPCSTATARRFLGRLFDGRDSAQEFLGFHLRNAKFKNFDFEVYLKAKNELKALESLPAIPSRDHFENHLAWLESAENRAFAKRADQTLIQELPTIEETLLYGTPRQKKALALWSREYGSMFDKKFTPHQLKRATADLSLILNDSRLDLGELTRHGLDGATERFLKSDAQATVFEKGLLEIFGKKNLLRDANLLERVSETFQKTTFKWSLNAATNTGFFLSSKYVLNGILITLPRQQLVRMTTKDMALLLVEGWQKQGLRLTEKYAPQVRKQIFYNATKETLGNASYITTIMFANYFIRNYINYSDKIEAQRTRTEVERPAR